MPVSIDLHSPYASIGRKAAAPVETREMRAARSTTLDAPFTAPTPYAAQKHVRIRRDRGRVIEVTQDGITVRADEAAIDTNGKLIARHRARRF